MTQNSKKNWREKTTRPIPKSWCTPCWLNPSYPFSLRGIFWDYFGKYFQTFSHQLARWWKWTTKPYWKNLDFRSRSNELSKHRIFCYFLQKKWKWKVIYYSSSSFIVYLFSCSLWEVIDRWKNVLFTAENFSKMDRNQQNICNISNKSGN